MNQRLKVTGALFGLLLLAGAGYWAAGQQHTLKADESSDLLLSGLHPRITAAQACFPNDQDTCFPFLGEKNSVLNRVNSHLQSMVLDVSNACLMKKTKDGLYYVPDPEENKGRSEGLDYWSCNVTDTQTSTNPQGQKIYTFTIQTTVEPVSSDKKVFFRQNPKIDDPWAQQELTNGEQRLELDGSVTGTVTAVVTSSAAGPAIRSIALQRPAAGEETASSLSGDIAIKATYNTDSARQINVSILDPDVDHNTSKKSLAVKGAVSLQLAFHMDNKVDKKGQVSASNSVQSLSICDATCQMEAAVTYTLDHNYQPSSTDSALYGTTSYLSKQRTIRQAAGMGVDGNRLNWTTYTIESPKVDNENTAKTNLMTKKDGTTTHAWQYDGSALRGTRINVFDTNDSSVELTHDEHLTYDSTDALPAPPGQKIFDKGKVDIHLNGRATANSFNVTGNSHRENPLGSIDSSELCINQVKDGTGNATGKQFVFSWDGAFKSSGPILSKGTCYNPFDQIAGNAFRNLELYLRGAEDVHGFRLGQDDRSFEEGQSLSNESLQVDFTSATFNYERYYETHALPASATVVFTVGAGLTRDQVNAVTKLFNHELSLKYGVKVDVKSQFVRTAQDALNIVRTAPENSWLVVIGKDLAGFNAYGQKAPGWVVKALLEAKSTKMSVIQPGGKCGATGGYANLAESVLPLGEGPTGSENSADFSIGKGARDSQGIWTSNFEDAANDVSTVISKTVGCQ